jgi:cobalt-zinc-cadmium efflux system protein
MSTTEKSEHQHGEEHHHDEEHEHAGHAHGHQHAPVDFSGRFVLGIVLNVGFVAVEAFIGLLSHSLSLLADAGHNLSDVLGLVLSWVALLLSRRIPSARHTYGWRRSSILAALLNALLLLVALGAIVWEAIQRIQRPEPIQGWTIALVSLVGIVVNGGTALLFLSGSKSDINVRSAFLHMAADAVTSLGVVLAGLIIVFTHWYLLDPIVSLVLAAVIFWGTWNLLHEAVEMSLDAVPSDINPESVKSFLQTWPGVQSVHDLHIWPLSTTEAALTAHLVMPEHNCDDEVVLAIGKALDEKFAIKHPTFQIERGVVSCPFAEEGVV